MMALATSAYAATQGTLGATSTGSANISITKSVQAQISDISDMTVANWSIGDGAVTLTSNVCVYSSTGSYRVTATGIHNDLSACEAMLPTRAAVNGVLLYREALICQPIPLG
jgi:hypothetical protein